MISPTQVYESMCGLLDDQACIPAVDNAFAPGKKCATLYDDIYEARQRLCQRFNIPSEDKDLEIIINSFSEIERELCIKMYQYGQLLSESQSNIPKEEP